MHTLSHSHFTQAPDFFQNMQYKNICFKLMLSSSLFRIKTEVSILFVCCRLLFPLFIFCSFIFIIYSRVPAGIILTLPVRWRLKRKFHGLARVQLSGLFLAPGSLITLSNNTKKSMWLNGGEAPNPDESRQQAEGSRPFHSWTGSF